MRQLNPTASSYTKTAARRAYEAHRRIQDAGLLKALAVHQSPRWRKLSKLYRQAHPLCCDPFKRHEASGRVVLSKQVHHIIGIQRDESLAYDESNFAAVCCACHRRLEALEAKGQSTVHLFNNSERITSKPCQGRSKSFGSGTEFTAPHGNDSQNDIFKV